VRIRMPVVPTNSCRRFSPRAGGPSAKSKDKLEKGAACADPLCCAAAVNFFERSPRLRCRHHFTEKARHLRSRRIARNSPPADGFAARRITYIAAISSLRLRYGALLRYDSGLAEPDDGRAGGLAEQAIDTIRLIRRGVSGVWDCRSRSSADASTSSTGRRNPSCPRCSG
jgi:hypothetical protein